MLQYYSFVSVSENCRDGSLVKNLNIKREIFCGERLPQVDTPGSSKAMVGIQVSSPLVGIQVSSLQVDIQDSNPLVDTLVSSLLVDTQVSHNKVRPLGLYFMV